MDVGTLGSSIPLDTSLSFRCMHSGISRSAANCCHSRASQTIEVDESMRASSLLMCLKLSVSLSSTSTLRGSNSSERKSETAASFRCASLDMESMSRSAAVDKLKSLYRSMVIKHGLWSHDAHWLFQDAVYILCGKHERAVAGAEVGPPVSPSVFSCR